VILGGARRHPDKRRERHAVRARSAARHQTCAARFLHLAADAAVSFGVVVAGIGILFTGWLWLDPLAGLAIAVAIVWSTWGLLRDSVALALNAVPSTSIRAWCAPTCPGSRVSRRCTICTSGRLSTTETALTVHLVIPGGHPGDGFMADVCRELRARYHVHHATIQIETGAQPCELAPDHVV